MSLLRAIDHGADVRFRGPPVTTMGTSATEEISGGYMPARIAVRR
jgi:hypothetical protein